MSTKPELKKDYCENDNSILGYPCKYEIPSDSNSKGILTIEHWDGNPNNNELDNLITLCRNCAGYKTNKYEDWKTPGRNLKVVEGENHVDPIDFIYKDWIAYCNQPGFKKIRDNIGIIVGKTGQGKTHSITQYIIPEWTKPKHDLKLVVVSAPQKGILDASDFVSCASENGWVKETNIHDALELLENGFRVIFLSTHQGLTNKNGEKLLDYCKDNEVKHAIVIDEAHAWLCTSLENYKKVVGHKNRNFNASLFKLLTRVCKYNPYVFGLTATPNREQTGKISFVKNSNIDYKIVNKSCPKELLLPKQAWIKEVGHLNLQNVTETYDRIKQRIIEIEQSYLKTGVKKSLMITCAISGFGNPYEIDLVLEKVKKIYKELGIEDEFKICVMTSDRNEAYTPNGDINIESEDSLKRYLNNIDNSLSVLLVVQKGAMGMNINTLSGLMVLKKSDKDDGEGIPLNELSIQVIGRLVRPNVYDVKKLKNEFDYNLASYFLSLSSPSEREDFIEANSFFVDIPSDNEMWESAVQDFKDKYVNDVEFARESLYKIEDESIQQKKELKRISTMRNVS